MWHFTVQCSNSVSGVPRLFGRISEGQRHARVHPTGKPLIHISKLTPNSTASRCPMSLVVALPSGSLEQRSGVWFAFTPVTNGKHRTMTHTHTRASHHSLQRV